MTDVLTRTLPAPPVAQPDTHGEADGAALAGTVAERLLVVVAPSTGRFRPRDGVASVEAGELIGHVTGGKGRADEVRSPVRAVLYELLVRPGQLVSRGQGLIWLGRA